jgi:hypothetical protein
MAAREDMLARLCGPGNHLFDGETRMADEQSSELVRELRKIRFILKGILLLLALSMDLARGEVADFLSWQTGRNSEESSDWYLTTTGRHDAPG